MFNLTKQFEYIYISKILSYKIYGIVVIHNNEEKTIYCYSSPWIKDIIKFKNTDLLYGSDDNIKFKAIAFKQNDIFCCMCPHIIENAFGNILSNHNIEHKRRVRYDGSYIGDFETKNRIIEVKSVLGSVLTRGYFPWPLNSTITNKNRTLNKFLDFAEKYTGDKLLNLVLIGGNIRQNSISFNPIDYNLLNRIKDLLIKNKFKINVITFGVNEEGIIYIEKNKKIKFHKNF